MKYQRKSVDISQGLLSDRLVYEFMNQISFDEDGIVLPFLNINNEALSINRRSETGRKALIRVGKSSYFIIKEFPWYCSDKSFVEFALSLQVEL
jgi:predicted GNAT superfamily acetyltransferase